VVECNLAKVDVEGSNPFSRSRQPQGTGPVSETVANRAVLVSAGVHTSVHTGAGRGPAGLNAGIAPTKGRRPL
jgi:hypothetical protein